MEKPLDRKMGVAKDGSGRRDKMNNVTRVAKWEAGRRDLDCTRGTLKCLRWVKDTKLGGILFREEFILLIHRQLGATEDPGAGEQWQIPFS